MCGARAAGDGVGVNCSHRRAKPASARSADENADSPNKPLSPDAQRVASEEHDSESECDAAPHAQPPVPAAMTPAVASAAGELLDAVTEASVDAADEGAMEASTAEAGTCSTTAAEAVATLPANAVPTEQADAQAGASQFFVAASGPSAEGAAQPPPLQSTATRAQGSVLAGVAGGSVLRPRRSSGAVWNTATYRDLWQLAVEVGETQAASIGSASDVERSQCGGIEREQQDDGDFKIGTGVAQTGAEEAAAARQQVDSDAPAETHSLSTSAAGLAGEDDAGSASPASQQCGEPGAERASAQEQASTHARGSSSASESSAELEWDGRDPMERYSITTVCCSTEDGATGGGTYGDGAL